MDGLIGDQENADRDMKDALYEDFACPGWRLAQVENYCHKRAIKRGQRGSEITCSKERKNPTYVDQHQNAAREKLFEQTTDFCKFPMRLTKILPDRSCLIS